MNQGVLHLLLSVALLYTAIIAPLKALSIIAPESYFLYPDLVASALFFLDFIYYKIRPSPLNKALGLACILPVELILLRPEVSPVLALFSLIRLHRFIGAYKFLATNRVEGRFYRLYFILAGGFTAIHFITCVWMALNHHSYLKSLYWTITTLTTTGYGDITPTSDGGRLFTIFVMIIGFSAFGIIVGNVSNLLMASNRHKEAKKERLEDLALFMKHYEVPKKLQKDIFSFYDHQIKKRLSDNDSHIISDLPFALQKEVTTYMKIKLIREIPLFKSLSKDCLVLIAKSLEQVSFAANETIIDIGDLAKEMFIIDHGEVSITDQEGRPIALLKQGQCFGEIALLKDLPRTAKVQSLNYCDVYVFKKQDFMLISMRFPKLRENLATIMQERLDPRKVA